MKVKASSKNKSEWKKQEQGAAREEE
jgi:hypothetical protein